MGGNGEEIEDFEGTLAIKNGKPVVRVSNEAEKTRLKEILRNKRVSIVEEKKKKEICPFEPEKDYKQSFCGFLDEWLREEVPGTVVSRADALTSVRLAKEKILASEGEKEKTKEGGEMNG